MMYMIEWLQVCFLFMVFLYAVEFCYHGNRFELNKFPQTLSYLGHDPLSTLPYPDEFSIKWKRKKQLSKKCILV